MTTVKSKQKNKLKKMTFAIKAAMAEEVILMGDFNNWNSQKHKMKKDKNGLWIKTVHLSLGKYKYKFLIDGEWQIDPLNPQTCLNCFGTLNSVVTLSG